MSTYLVVTLIGDDEPGLVEALARTIAEHDGNWLESRMSHLAGKFAGVLRVSVPTQRIDSLRQALTALGPRGLRVLAEIGTTTREEFRVVRLQLTGADHPGIVRDISTTLARRRVNVEDLETSCSAAPMSGQPLFSATARLQLPRGVALDDLRRDLEAVAQDLMVDVLLAEDDQAQSR